MIKEFCHGWCSQCRAFGDKKLCKEIQSTGGYEKNDNGKPTEAPTSREYPA